MRIAGGILTRKRSSSGQIADVLSQVCDDVVVISSQATCSHSSRNVTVVEQESKGEIGARNDIRNFAIDGDYDFLIMSDDDVMYKPSSLRRLVEVVDNNPNLGALALPDRVTHFYNSRVKSNKPFVLFHVLPMIWCARVSVLKEIGSFMVNYAADLDYCARLWKSGYAVGLLIEDIQETCTPMGVVNPSSRISHSGGLQDDSNETNLKRALAYISKNHSEVYRIERGYPGPGRNSYETIRNWPKMIKFCTDRFGLTMGYEDSSGRKL